MLLRCRAPLLEPLVEPFLDPFRDPFLDPLLEPLLEPLWRRPLERGASSGTPVRRLPERPVSQS